MDHERHVVGLAAGAEPLDQLVGHLLRVGTGALASNPPWSSRLDTGAGVQIRDRLAAPAVGKIQTMDAMDDANKDEVTGTNYEQIDPHYPTEEEVIERTTRRLGEALHKLDDAQRRIARNAGHDPGQGRP